jgi:hypothetical protein
MAAGGNLGTVTVSVENSSGSVVTTSAASITVTITGPNGYSQAASGTAVNGVASLNLSSFALTASGAYTVTTTSPGFPTDTSSLVVTAATAIATSTTLTASPDPLADGQSATLTATVSPAPTGTPAGTVDFYSGATLLGTAPLNASGVATFTTNSLVVGADSITAVYPGNASFAASTSSAVSETVTTSYTVTGPTTPISVAAGGSVNVNITVPPLGGAFNNVVTLSASGLPPGATATFNPPTVMPGSAGATTVMTIQLAAVAASIHARDIPANHRGLPVGPFSLGFILFGAVLGRKRIPRTLVLPLALAVLGVTASMLTGCGGSAGTPATPAQNYTVTVTGTSGSFQTSTTVTLVVE